MKSIAISSLLLCTLFAFISAQATTPSSPNIQLDVYPGSNAWWLALAVKNGDVDTQSVQIKDSSKSSSYVDMEYTAGWGYWTYASKTGSQLVYPVSVMVKSVNGDEVGVDNIITSALVGTVDLGAQYGSEVAPPIAPTSRSDNNNKHATTTTTRAPKHASTTRAPKATTTTEAPSKAPTKAPTSSAKTTTTTTTTKAPSTSKATTTTTKASTSGASSGTGCSAAMSLLVPLYVDPGSAWDTVIASASVVHTVAIINPDSGPGTGPDSSYTTYMGSMATAGVEMIGYVHTSYGARAIADVKADVDVYAAQFPHLSGIFVDECATSSSELSYYTELYAYIMSFPGWKYTVINPGTVPAAGYSAAATQIVTYEDTASGFPSSPAPSGASCSNKNEFAVITYSASSASSMETAVQSAVSKGYYGWFYATSGTASGNTYGSLPSYYAEMASYVASSA